MWYIRCWRSIWESVAEYLWSFLIPERSGSSLTAQHLLHL